MCERNLWLYRFVGSIGFLLVLCFFAVGSSRTEPEKVNANRPVHDPCMIRQGEFYYVLSTGRGIPIRRSKDLVHWEATGRVFTEDVPEWARKAIVGSSSLWAPDISYANGRYFLYYSVSTFGKNRSVIGLATNKTLDPASPEYRWNDNGKVVESFPTDDYNAIDPNLVPISNTESALSFGSFWSGIKLIKVDQKTGKPLPGAEVVSISQRPAPDAQEAPFIIRHKGHFYLFVSFDNCCRGKDSTYNIRVGRSRNVEGPYTDRARIPLLKGGGTLVLTTNGRYIGPGHCAVLQEKGRDLLVYHFYDGDANGVSTLQVSPLRWDKEDWPVVGPPLE